MSMDVNATIHLSFKWLARDGGGHSSVSAFNHKRAPMSCLQ